MAVRKTAVACLAFLVCLAMLVGNVSAGVLPAHADAYDSGATPFDNGTLTGTIEWAVFAPGDFPFTPTGSWAPDDAAMTYVYQLYSTGTDHVSSYTVPIYNPADNIGAFEDAPDITGVLPASSSLSVPGSAQWFFSIATGENSSAVAFSSPQLPTDIYSVVVNGGGYAIAVPVPTPGSTSIPEPGTTALLVGALTFLAFIRRK